MRTLHEQAESVTRLQKGMLFAAVVFIGVFAAFVYRPQTKKIVALQKTWDVERIRLDANQNEAQRLPEVAREVALLKQKLDGFDRRLPPQEELGPFMNDVTNSYQQLNLRKWTWGRGETRKNDFFAELPIRLNFEGDYVNVMAFLRQAEDMPRLTRVRSLKLHGKEDKPGQVEVELSMNIYYAEQ